ncbi:MAG: hypothetical protein LBT30_01635 [Clostridiales bacterium]|jgi:hypothetical protein|nr:hypothetical protein [Clostridiales bacterium]
MKSNIFTMNKKLTISIIAAVLILAIAIPIIVWGIGKDKVVWTADALTSKPTAPQGNVPKLLDSYTDGSNNYFLLDAGYIRDIYVSTIAQVDYTGLPMSLSKTVTETGQISNSFTETISNAYYFSRTDSTKISIGADFTIPIGKIKTSFEWTWSGTTSTTNTKSTSSTSTTVRTFAESQVISYSFGKNSDPIGRYRYAIYGVCDVYYKVQTSMDNQTLTEIDILMCLRSEKDQYVVRTEYSANGVFTNPTDGEIVFSENFYKSLPIPTNSGSGLLPQTAYITTTSLSCKLDNGYNYDQVDPNGANIHYSHNFSLGDFVVEGANYTDGQITLINGYSMSIAFRLGYDAGNLPLQHTMTSRYINSDGKSSNFYNMPWTIGERTVGYGMLVALVHYNDGTPDDRICVTDFFKNKKAGDFIYIKENVTKECTVTIAIVYEVTMWAPGFLGISDDYWMNWRINQSFNAHK